MAKANSKGMADVGVLPDSAHMEGNEMVGIKDSGYLDKKGLPTGPGVHYQTLPPGMNIDDQKNADIRPMTLKTYEGGMGFRGDGWTSGTDRGRGGV